MVELDDAFKEVLKQMSAAERLEDCLWELESQLLSQFQAERFTIYQKDANGHEIVSMYRTSRDAVEEIRLHVSPASIAGYVAQTQQSLMVDDAYDSEYLEGVNNQLQFDHSFDQASGYLTEAMITVPIIWKEKLVGVLQVINNVKGGPFQDETYYMALEVAKLIAEKFRYEMKTGRGPYDQLVQDGRLKLDQLEDAEVKAASTSKPITEILRKEYEITSEEIGRALSAFYQLPFHNYSEEKKIDKALLENLNKNFMATNYWVPIENDGEKAVILIADPSNEELIMEIQNIIRAVYCEFHVALGEDIHKYLGLDVKGNSKMDAFTNLDAMIVDARGLDISADAKKEEDDDILNQDQESQVIQLVNKIIAKAYNDGVSDIHIEPHKGAAAGEVRFRVDGVCRTVMKIPASLMRPAVSRIKILSNLDIAERRKPQDGKISLKISGKVVELRVATLPVVNGESAVMRILAAGDKAMPFDKLMLSDSNQEAVRDFIANPHGLILVVGPTGSGKTTTLHAILALLNDGERKILTAEDPVEITQPGLQQVQVLPKAGYTFAIALRAFLRCDPDIILIGEMRDHETAGAGVEASLTGHLVFSTLHTNSAPETVIRLLDIGLDPLNFADCLVGVVAQRLVRTLCPKCKVPHKPNEELMHRLKHFYGEEYYPELKIDEETIELRKMGDKPTCDKCLGTGTRGRVGIHEVLKGTTEMKKLVAKRAPVAPIRDQAIADGMRTLMQDGIWKIFKGSIDFEQLQRVCHH